MILSYVEDRELEQYKIKTICNSIRTNIMRTVPDQLFYNVDKIQEHMVPEWLIALEESAYKINLKNIS